MAAALQVPFARLEPWAEGLATVRAEGFAIIALTPNRAAETLDRFAARAERTARFALLLGAEGAGLTSQAEAMADYRVRIPIRPDVDSLNLAVAAGIALSRLSERRNL
jgi:tRNA G18 (ribose-2'-O)-methylase SpoU